MQQKNYYEFENIDDSTIEDVKEYALYSIETERTMRETEKKLSDIADPKKAAMVIMKAAIVFYEADWCGIINVDSDVGVWTPLWWCNDEFEEMVRTDVNEFELLEQYKRWLDCLSSHEPMVIEDIEEVKDSYPDEYALYRRLQAKSIMAVPFWKSLHGFFVVRNPKKYKTHTSLLRMFNYAIVCSLNQYYLMESRKLSIISPRIRNERDVYITLFGELSITTVKGVLTEREMKSPKQAKFLAYILLNKRVASSSREIAEALFGDEDIDIAVKNMKGLVYRLQQAFSLLSDYRLIVSTPNGYQINHDLNIFTDVQLFDNKVNLALNTSDKEEKVETLKKAVELYKGSLFNNYRQEHWILSKVVAYEYRYIGALGELLKTLNENDDYCCIQHYAGNALRVVKHNVDAYYWLLVAMYKTSHAEMARNQLKLAQTNFLTEEYEELIKRLKENGFFTE